MDILVIGLNYLVLKVFVYRKCVLIWINEFFGEWIKLFGSNDEVGRMCFNLDKWIFLMNR